MKYIAHLASSGGAINAIDPERGHERPSMKIRKIEDRPESQVFEFTQVIDHDPITLEDGTPLGPLRFEGRLRTDNRINTSTIEEACKIFFANHGVTDYKFA